ncbi:MAG TPA: hypothetical protein VMT82_02465 [candidate division Zixibacteria bacterium]|nr:hypothetical protein [candidate division Zixibacteria bacterium]
MFQFWVRSLGTVNSAMRNLFLGSICLFSSLLFSQSNSRTPNSYSPPPGFQNTPFKLMVLDHQIPHAFVCTVVTEDLRLRQEVSTLYQGKVDSVRVFEAPATTEDLTKVEELLSSAEFQSAKPNLPRVGTVVHGRNVTIITSDHRARNFFDEDRGGLPKSVANFIKFTEATRWRKLPKVTGKPELICPIPMLSAVKITHATE